jgi:hypothetical protein
LSLLQRESPFPASGALIRAIIEALNAIYFTAGLMAVIQASVGASRAIMGSQGQWTIFVKIMIRGDNSTPRKHSSQKRHNKSWCPVRHILRYSNYANWQVQSHRRLWRIHESHPKGRYRCFRSTRLSAPIGMIRYRQSLSGSLMTTFLAVRSISAHPQG